MKYYTHIDGLRAISILLILFYHAGFTSFRYGYIGVDIFFVISGFLITSSIINSGKFSYSSFYERRIRRILPALFFMCSIATVFAWFLLTPKELKDFGRSLFSSTNMISNFYFWKTQNYHAQLSSYKPLIHTWSLSIEEQYYLLFPAFLIFLRQYKYYLITILFLALSSLLLQWLTITFNMEAAAFYLPICRVWEIFIGVIGAIYQRDYLLIKSHTFKSLLSFIGFMLIILSVMLPIENASTIQNIIAVIGTIFVILFSNHENLIGKILGNKIFTPIGLSSFSIYLYHQPIFAFYRSYLLNISQITYTALIIFSILVGYISYQLIEIKFKKMKKSILFGVLFLMWSSLTLLGLLFHMYDGFPSRYSIESQRTLNYQNYDYENSLRSKSCLITDGQSFKSFPIECYGNDKGKSTIVIWGDSHAAGLYYGFSNLRQNVAQFTTTSCPPYLDEIYNRNQCNNINRWVLNEIHKIGPKEVFLHAYWSGYNQKSIFNLAATINEIKRTSPNSKIVIIGNTPYWHPSLPLFLLKYADKLGPNQEFLPFNIDSSNSSDKFLESISKKLNVNFIPPLNFLCIKNECLYKIKDKANGALIFYDSDHLTKEGSLYISLKILKILSDQE